MEKSIVIQPEKCTGCRTCELVCSFHHTGEFNPARSRISVVSFEKVGFSFPAVCQQCTVAACMQVCPVGAIVRNDLTGAMEVNHDICLRCKMCMMACPFGATMYDETANIMIKCDLCGGDPECVKLCPSGAITFEETNINNLSKRRTLAGKMRDLFEEGA
ncbi:MAG: 4Fe-4S dicluster domain-containing protein [Bacillota bacterium]|nr:4Fe-4S dicluster domain-containing protein [Bacillota bacterium]